MRRALPAVTLALALSPALSGCAAAATEPPAAAPRDWREPAAYTYVLDSRCGEQPLIGRFRITVADRKVTTVAALDEAARNAPTAAPKPTIGALMLELESARRAGAAVAKADHDPADGHPTRITIDRDADAVDDELCYTITGYTP